MLNRTLTTQNRLQSHATLCRRAEEGIANSKGGALQLYEASAVFLVQRKEKVIVVQMLNVDYTK